MKSTHVLPFQVLPMFMRKLIMAAALITMLLPAYPSYALFGQKKARAEAEQRAAQAQAQLETVKHQVDEAKVKAEADHQLLEEKAASERRTLMEIICVISILSVACVVYALTHRKTVYKTVDRTVHQVVNVQIPPRDIVSDFLIIDGANVIGKCGGNPTTLLRLLGVIMELHKRNYRYTCFFDASTFHVLMDCGMDHHAHAYRSLLNDYPTTFVEVPSRTQADDAILDYAHRHGTPIISNDQYRDHQAKFTWLNGAANRRIPFVVHPAMVQLCPLGIEAKLPISLSTALNEYRHLVGSSTASTPSTSGVKG